MGNIVDIIAKNKTESLLTFGTVAFIYFLFREANEKAELRGLLKKIAQNGEGIKEPDFSTLLNQVYLKENVEHHSIRNNSDHPIYKIVITGGPCAGKTTSLTKIRDDLTAKGFRVFSVP